MYDLIYKEALLTDKITDKIRDKISDKFNKMMIKIGLMWLREMEKGKSKLKLE